MSKKDPILIAFGNKLREIRMLKGISQENLAHKAGVHRNYIGILERGEQSPTLLVLVKIARALDVDFNTLIPKS